MFCKHKWKIMGKSEYFDTSYNCKLPRTAYHLQCEKCGNLKEKTIFHHVYHANKTDGE